MVYGMGILSVQTSDFRLQVKIWIMIMPKLAISCCVLSVPHYAHAPRYIRTDGYQLKLSICEVQYWVGYTQIVPLAKYISRFRRTMPHYVVLHFFAPKTTIPCIPLLQLNSDFLKAVIHVLQLCHLARLLGIKACNPFNCLRCVIAFISPTSFTSLVVVSVLL